jgi:hypothetical protein
MNLLIFIVATLVLSFGFVVLFGAPYLPTRKQQTETALDLLDLKSGQTLLELGCGDGRVLKAAAQRGIRGIGYELNPILVIVARLYTWSERKNVKIIWGNYWTQPWPKADGIFVFLLNKLMPKLDTKITQEFSDPVKLVSYAFAIPGKKPVTEKGGLYLYRYS